MSLTRRLGINPIPVWRPWVDALLLSFDQPEARARSIIIFVLLLIAHLVLLPAHILGPEIGLRSFQHISIKIAVFACLFALFESVLINLWVYLLRHKARCKTIPAAGGVVIGVVSPLLCCTPLLPSILSLVAIVFPSAVSGLGIKVQYAVNVYQTELLTLAVLLLLFAIAQNVRYLTQELSSSPEDQ